MALAAFGEAKLIEHPNLFFAVAIVQPGQQPAVVQQELQKELERVKAEGVTATDLVLTLTQLLRNALNVAEPPFFPRESVRVFLWFQLVVLAQILPDPDDRSIIDYYKGDYPDYHISKVGPFSGKHSATEKFNAH